MPRFPAVLITGASSGIGRALALALAEPGVTLHLAGRDAARLQATADAAARRGAVVKPEVLDVCDAAAMAGWIAGAGRLDLVIANAGISAGAPHDAPEPAAQIRAVFATNLDGVLNTVLPALEVMRCQPAGLDGVRGRIAAIASIAAFVAAPGAGAYCASKAAVDTWMVASAPGAGARGIQLCSVCPGYIRTAMTAENRFPMPGLMEAERAARIILRGIGAGRVRIAFPWWLAAMARIAGLLPPRLLGTLLATQPAKAPMTGGPG
jgi:NAD(P)-dependent dehydrogenase (short-subunit alcohol dehydrogenase family)